MALLLQVHTKGAIILVYALGDPSLCVVHLESVPELLQFQNHIPNSGSTQSSVQGSQGFLAPSVNYTPSTTSFTGSFPSVVDITPMEIRDGRAWAMAQRGQFA